MISIQIPIERIYLEKARAARQEIHTQVPRTRGPIRDIIDDHAAIDHYQKDTQSRIDLLQLVDILTGSSKLGAPIVVNGRGWNAEGFEVWLLFHGMIPVFLPLREGRQKGVDYLLQQIIMDTPGTRARELVLLSTDGEHFTVSLEHIRSLGVHTIVAKLPKTPQLLLDAADEVIDLTSGILDRCQR